MFDDSTDELEVLVLHTLPVRWQPPLGQAYVWRLKKINPQLLWLFFLFLLKMKSQQIKKWSVTCDWNYSYIISCGFLCKTTRSPVIVTGTWRTLWNISKETSLFHRYWCQISSFLHKYWRLKRSLLRVYTGPPPFAFILRITLAKVKCNNFTGIYRDSNNLWLV